MTGKANRRLWDVQRALSQMHGMEHATRLLLADLDREIVDRDSYGVTRSPRSIGIAVTTTVQCTLFCEYAIKTFHASLSGGAYKKGHLLATRPGKEKMGLYDHLEERYMAVEGVAYGELSRLVISQMRSREACCPNEWVSDISDVRITLQTGSTNFDDWRYGYPETGQLSGGVPKGLFAIGKGLELLSRISLARIRMEQLCG